MSFKKTTPFFKSKETIERAKKMFENVEQEIVLDYILERLIMTPEKLLDAINENVCPQCNNVRELQLRHQNCSYVERHKNYYLACDLCQNEIWENYQERWNDLYSL